MKAPPFAYARPASLDEAVALLDAHGDEAKILAGGQSLMATLNMRLSAPKLLIDINRIPGLSGIEASGGAVRIGAMTRYSAAAASPALAKFAPLFAAALPHIAHPAIRNRGTIGGSLAFGDPAAELPACAVAAGASFILRGPDGERIVAAEDFYLGLYETEMKPNEILTRIDIPAADGTFRWAFHELARRHGDYAIIGLAALGAESGGTLAALNLVFFGAGDRPVAAPQAALALIGKALGDDTIAAAQDALESDIDPPEDLNADKTMRVYLARNLLKKASADLAQAR